jgi:predicted phosphodiesterase
VTTPTQRYKGARRTRRGRGLVTLVAPDIHVPNHNRPAVNTFLQACKLVMPDVTVFLGDALDMTSWTRHAGSSIEELGGHDYMVDGIEPFRRFLAEVRRWTGKIVMVEGNHEQWAERKLVQDLPTDLAKLGIRTMTPHALLGDLFDEWIPYARQGIPHYKIAPNLWAVHGWSIAKYASAKHQDLARVVSVVHGHTHRVQRWVDRNPVTEDYLEGWSPGCLSQFQPAWKHGQPTNWARGLSTIYHSKNDPNDWHADTALIRARDGRAILDGGMTVSPDYDWRKANPDPWAALKRK